METKKEDALEIIRFCRDEGISDEKIRINLNTRLKLPPDTIDELFKQVDSELVISK